jgi:twinkle protein
MDVRQYLKSKGLEWSEVKRPAGLQAVMHCPFCDDREKKFGINLTTGAFKCMRENKCGVSGGWYDFQRLLKDDPNPLDKPAGVASATRKEYSKPAPKKRFVIPTGSALDFVASRGISMETITKLKIAQVEGEQVIAFPYYRDGKLVNVKYRKIESKEFWSEKGCEPVLWNRDNVRSNVDWLIITEGEFDAAALVQYGFDAVSIPGGAKNTEWIETEWEWLERFKTIMLCYDSDVAGNEGANEAAKRLGEWRCKRVDVPDGHKDFNDCLKHGVDVVVVRASLVSAQDYTPDSLFPMEYYTDEIINLIENPSALQGTPTFLKSLTEILGGWRYNEYSVWSGQNYSGKSTILNQVIIDLAVKGIPVCIASLEMPPKRYLRWAMVQYTHNAFPSPERVHNAMRTIGHMIYVVDLQSDCEIGALLDKFKYAARRYGCRHFVIDSLMMIKTDSKRELEHQASICKSICAFAKEYNVHVHLVAHPRKGTDDDERPGKVDVMGTGHITNLADNVFIMWRPSEELKEKARSKNKYEIPPDAILYVKKNREIGTSGKVKLWFNATTKSYTEDENEE